MTSLVWFRQDLRLADNPAWSAACAAGQAAPIYIFDDSTPAIRPIGTAGRWWLHESLSALDEALDGALILRRGDPLIELEDLIRETGARSLFWNRVYEPAAIARDKTIKASISALGVETRSFNASLLHEPWEVRTKAGAPYKMFTPYWRAASQLEVDAPLPTVLHTSIARKVGRCSLTSWNLKPSKPDWAAHWAGLWSPGERGAVARLTSFIKEGLGGYSRGRDRPDLAYVSRLSPHLHWGEISPRQIWTALHHAVQREGARSSDCEIFLRELYWREFCHHLLYHYPELPERNWRPEFDAFPWRDDVHDLEAWRRGRTGYPFVDAGMRELWATGYMHNRVRMAAASFLVKHLRIHWREGERWFWDTLVDADLANNGANWQWVAGTGADAAPYFRIFNPAAQGRKFDPDGAYVRRWIPELRRLPNQYIHAPFAAPLETLRAAGVRLGETYPRPIVELDAGRASALAGYEAVRNRGRRREE
jgi:deoxyribodipyrimidine photo-lyase